MKDMTLEALVVAPLQEWYGKVVDIPVNLIKPDPDNLRQSFDEADLLDLANNMDQVGQLDEITVFPILTDQRGWDGFFDLHDGERRWRAATLSSMPTLRAKVVPRPSDEELTFKKVSRVLQTRSLDPETKLIGLKRAFSELGILQEPEEWNLFKDKLGGGPEWPQLVRVLQLDPKVREMFEGGQINFTIAQSIGRVPQEKQRQLAEYVVINKLNGRFFSTQMVPYIIEHPDASPAQAFEHTRVGGWRQFSRSPYQRGSVPPAHEQVDKFLEACVAWERAWETVVIQGLVHEIRSDSQYTFRLKDASRRIQERAAALAARMEAESDGSASTITASTPINANRVLTH